MITFLRSLKIIITLKRYGLFQILRIHHKTSRFGAFLDVMLFFIPQKFPDKPLPQRIRLALEQLGPVFVKLGQLLSTRPDLLPKNYLDELSQLQSRVAPFPYEISRQIIERSLGQPIQKIFCEFSDQPVASASIAQVHRARLIENNHEVAIKVMRPNIETVINNDIRLLKLVAVIIEKIFKDGKRLQPRQVVKEFENTIHEELDFLQEAANNTELARLHKKDQWVIIPHIYYDYCTREVIVMEWMNGTPISDIVQLRQKNIDLVKLSHRGVEIFYTQVFDFGFFHADMHPGNLLVSDDGRYIALDFGIIGCLSEEDKRYLAINLLAFFNHDYKKVAITHVESGWAPPDTPVEQFENAIRAVCEPIFNKPLAQISFAQILIKLFQISRRFGIIIQPQLILLQKTIVNIEGLGRTLNPQLDLWQTAKPILNRWLKQQMGFNGFVKNMRQELPHWTYILPQFPRQIAKILSQLEQSTTTNNNQANLIHEYRRMNQILIVLMIVIIIILFMKL